MSNLTRRSGLAALLAALLAPLAPADRAPGGEPAKQIVTLTVDYGDGVQKRFTRLPWREGMTVLHALEAARKHPRGIQFEYRGRGATAFLHRIDDVSNEGRGRNWIYRVNGQLAERSFGARPLDAGDDVLWEFAQYR